MTSASVAVKRLQSESLQQKSLNELKQDAAELGLSKEEVKQFGSLSMKATWLAAIGDAVAREFDAVETEEEAPVKPKNDPSPETAPGEIEELPFETDTTPVEPVPTPGIDESDEIETVESITVQRNNCPEDATLRLIEELNARIITAQRNNSPALQAVPGGDFVQKHLPPSEPIPPIEPEPIENWDEKLMGCVLNEEPSLTPMRDELYDKMLGYIGKGLTEKDLEDMQNNPPDEYIAAIYLGFLEESERMLQEAIPV
ncbi:MAG: hypothetical protein ACKPH7_03590 [Planktothrix sp.]|uniref:hypothetical protein n=1 Tax=Planktothrix sp. TaxID=3088171 RepID=UPI0038D37187